MQEREARSKWCPMVRLSIGPDNMTWQNKGYTNRATDFDHGATLCLGSECMAWKWKEDQWKCNKCGAIFPRYYDECPDDFDSKTPKCEGTLDVFREGVCGLADK